MKLQFDKQQYQLDAIQSVVDVFDGQSVAGTDTVPLDPTSQGLLTELGFGNRLTLPQERVLANVRLIQQYNQIEQQMPETGMHFSIEMETGTGKTYTYLRTIHELHARYGFVKFIIVVPSVAIREGVLKTLEITREHFSDVYKGHPFEYAVYDSKRLSSLRQFATSHQLQILVMNIDAFNKKENNVIYRDNDKLSGHKPIEFIQSTHPIVILDEPQNMESAQAKEAISSLSPLCTLRYSATHKNRYNLLYRLSPVQAYQMNLVKRIEVDSVTDKPDFRRPFVRVESITSTKMKVVAKLTIDVQGKNGPMRKTVQVSKSGADLYQLSHQRDAYRGYVVEEMDVSSQRITFANGIALQVGQNVGAHQDDIMRVQIQETVREHFEKELRVLEQFSEGKRVKVLSLLFIDRVAHYADANGKIRRWFEEAYEKYKNSPRYFPLRLPPVSQVHNGYFATDRKGKAKDTTGKTQADEEAFELIMRDKERLLSREEPLRFIFSHSALREGWDNPNVFQICTLNETRSDVKKRQEIGRGLRLPVDETGERLIDHPINRLTVIANESYEDFARALQQEIEEETGEAFPAPYNKHLTVLIQRREDWFSHAYFLDLWSLIKRKTRYSVQFDTRELIERAAGAVQKLPAVQPPHIQTEKRGIELSEQGIHTRMLSMRHEAVAVSRDPLPDFIGYIQQQTELTRRTIVEILAASQRLGDIFVNAQQFLDLATRAIRMTMQALMVEKIHYELTGEEYFEMLQKPGAGTGFAEYIELNASRIVYVTKSLYEAIEVDSKTEADFVQELESREDILFFLKLPRWFRVKTPVGSYNPDWAIVMEAAEGYRLQFMCETKGATDVRQLRLGENDKLLCGQAHFATLGIPYVKVKSARELTASVVHL